MEIKIKLKFMPNINNILNSTPTISWFQIVFKLYIPILLISIVNCIDFSPQTPIVSAATSKTLNETTAPKFNRDVKDLKLTADFRAVKLRWSYDYSEVANEPASFDIRYCELTSWDIEIKCRHRDLKVASNLRVGTRQQQLEKLSNTTTTNNDNEEKSVIPVKRLYPIETVQQLDSLNQYEVQIFDLRALTNYTFQVHVSRFLHEPEQLQNHSKVLNQTKDLEKNFAEKSFQQLERRTRIQAARRLNQNVVDEQHSDTNLRRIETKPFGAEATKCLADVSEVVINTGKYFGGRISVEDSSDPRCNLIGNKSSEQTSYLFRIDHHICDSKTVDGNRIETMVLVHENKDILTHNTARFLVLCNFLQKSFTLRASISLPKVNGILPQATRPAVITSLPQKPFDNNNSNNVTEDHSMSILLGSMPGVYRARSAAAAATSLSQQQQGNSPNTISNNNNNNKANSYTTILDEHLQQQVNQDVNRSSPNSNINHIVDELETNTIEKFIDKKSSRSSGQDKSVLTKSNASNSNSSSNNNNNNNNSPQQVVERQSKQLAGGAPVSQYNLGIAGGGNNLLATMLNANNYKPSSTLTSADSQRARSLTLSSLDANINKLPQPVQVQSRLLFVERSSPASRVGRQQQHPHQQHHSKPITIQANLVERSTSSQFDTLESGTSAVMQIHTTTAVPPTNTAAKTGTSVTTLQPDKVEENENGKDIPLSASRNLKQWPRNKQQVSLSAQQQRQQEEEVDADLQLKLQQSPSIIMTNNHRIPGDYLSLAKATTSSNSKPISGAQSTANSNNNNNNNNFSIKYSAAKVDEFSVGQGDVEVSLAEPVSAGTNYNNNTSRSHGGRMRSVEDEFRSLSGASSLNSQSKSQAKMGSSWTVDNRMGEVMGSSEVTSRNSNSNNLPAEPAQADLISETSNNEFVNDVSSQTEVPSVNGTLAQNITSFLLKWSLKTLTNLARKSFESLANQNGSQQAGSLNQSDFVSENEQHEYEQRNEPIHTDQMRVNQSNDRHNQPVASHILENSLKPSPAPQTQAQKANVTNNNRNSGGNETASVAPVAIVPLSQAKIVSELKKEVISTIKPTQINTSVKLLDDFMTSTSQVEELPKISTAPPQIAESLDNYHHNHHQHHHAKQNNHSRPSNYSKSLDFARIAGESTSHRPKNSEKNNIGKSNHHTRQRNQQQSIEERIDKPIQSNQESAWTNRDTFYSSWMFYGLLLFIAIITGIFLTFWLASMPLGENNTKVRSRSRHNVNNHNENHSYPDPQSCLQSQQRLVFNDSITSQTTLKLNHPAANNAACIANNNNNNLNSPRSRSLLDISYQKYDYNKFENFHSDVTSNNINTSATVHVNNNIINGNDKIINNNNSNGIHISSSSNQNKSNCDETNNRGDNITARLDQQSPSSTSLRTRSTSAGSTIMVDENDYKNNEFLYTEHVLINPGLSFGESYA